jgi:hypothetical protein
MFMRLIQMRIALVSLWLLAVGTGFAMFLNYQNTGGQSGATPAQWPASTRLTPSATGDTLVMFAHPQCPCTRASIAELNRLLARISDHATAQVWFYQPAKLSPDWSKTGLWRSAAAIPGVTVQADLDGAEARRFGAETSGTVLLYDPQGTLLFKGGITGSRGHAGDNPGESAITSLCLGQPANVDQTPVFGCSLFSQCDAPDTTGGAK